MSVAMLGPADFLDAAQALLPTGPLWSREPDSMMTALLSASVQSTARVHALAAQLTEIEAYPPTSQMLLPDWEAEYGLPDPCVPLNPSIEQRQAALAARMAATGGQSAAYFIGVAAALGYSVTIDTFPMFRVGISSCWDAVPAAGWQFAWVVNAPAIHVRYFEVGVSSCWDPLFTVESTTLACILNRIKPAYSTLIMKYS